MRQLLRYFLEELRMPPETIKLLVDGQLRSLALEKIYEQDKPQGPA